MDHSHHMHVTQAPPVHDHVGSHDGHEYNVVTDASVHDHMSHGHVTTDVMNHASHDHIMDHSVDHSMHDHVTDHMSHDMGSHLHVAHDHSAHTHLSYFHSSLNATALIEHWTLDTNASIFLACLCTFILAIGYQGTKWFRQYLHVNYRDRIHSIRSKEHVFQTVLYVTEFIVSYLLMLLVMTYNVWVFVLTILGITVGYFLLAWHKEFKPGCSQDCHATGIDGKNKVYDRNHSSQELMPLDNGTGAGGCGDCHIEQLDVIEENSG